MSKRTAKSKNPAPATTEPPSFKPAMVGVYTVQERLSRIHRRALLAHAALSVDQQGEDLRRILPATDRLMHEIITEIHNLEGSLPRAVLSSMAPTEEDRVCAARGEIEVYASGDYAFEF